MSFNEKKVPLVFQNIFFSMKTKKLKFPFKTFFCHSVTFSLLAFFLKKHRNESFSNKYEMKASLYYYVFLSKSQKYFELQSYNKFFYLQNILEVFLISPCLSTKKKLCLLLKVIFYSMKTKENKKTQIPIQNFFCHSVVSLLLAFFLKKHQY